MINLKQTTFISAIQVESFDRINNVKTVLNYLNHHLHTNFIIYNNGIEEDLSFLEDYENLNLKIIHRGKRGIFHRTKFLNECLVNVKTPVVCNYDIDVIFDKKIYNLAERMVLTKEADIVYPFPIGNAQIRVHQDFNREELFKSMDLKSIHDSGKCSPYSTFCGHAFFADTKKYQQVGGENEKFVSYGPEDRERLIRFEKLGLSIKRINDGVVYHFEHERTHDSSTGNPFFQMNSEEFNRVSNMTSEQIRNTFLPLCD